MPPKHETESSTDGDSKGKTFDKAREIARFSFQFSMADQGMPFAKGLHGIIFRRNHGTPSFQMPPRGPCGFHVQGGGTLGAPGAGSGCRDSTLHGGMVACRGDISSVLRAFFVVNPKRLFMMPGLWRVNHGQEEKET